MNKQRVNVKVYSFWIRIIRTIKYSYYRTLRSNAMPRTNARGVAIGVFIGFLPIVPFQTVVAICIAFILRSGKIGAALGTWISNPFTFIPLFYPINYSVGCLLYPTFAEYPFNKEYFNQVLNIKLADIYQSFSEAGIAGFFSTMGEVLSPIWNAYLAMCLGGVFLGIFASIAAYVLSLKAIKRYHTIRVERLRRKGRLQQL